MKRIPSLMRTLLVPLGFWGGLLGIFLVFAGPNLEMKSRADQSAQGLGLLAVALTPQRNSDLLQAYSVVLKVLEQNSSPSEVLPSLDAYNLGGQKILPQGFPELQVIPEEVRASLPRGVGHHTRYEEGVLKVFYAWAVFDLEGTPLGVLRLRMPLEDPFGHLWKVYLAVLLLVTSVAVWRVVVRVRRLGQGLERMTLAADAYGRGVARPLTHFEKPRELRILNSTLNESYKARDSLLTRERTEKADLEAVLESMVEGVVVMDPHLEVKRINPAAQRMFGLGGRDWKGATLLELCRSSTLQNLAQQLKKDGVLTEGTLTHNQRILQVNGSSLVVTGEVLGLVLVFHDVTRMKKLEEIRRDFVANVSHELKTPITNILGYVETLAEDSLDDRETVRRFLQVIEKNSRRLGTIIEDLLVLAKLEQGGSQSRAKEAADLSVIFEAAVQTCLPRMKQKETILKTSLPPAPALVYPSLVEQALVNLLDNAVKYSPSGTVIEVEISQEEEFWVLMVKDRGPGIPEKDLPRIFERFYRVDKARSLDLGGTGLGLSIVKHIALVHGGQASVESREGEGSRFMLRIPRKS